MKSKIKADVDTLTNVTPFTGVWIEIIGYWNSIYKGFFVTPFAGVWIEIDLTIATNLTAEVTPFAGVWIEIYMHFAYADSQDGHSLRGSVDWNILPHSIKKIYSYGHLKLQERVKEIPEQDLILTLVYSLTLWGYLNYYQGFVAKFLKYYLLKIDISINSYFFKFKTN